MPASSVRTALAIAALLAAAGCSKPSGTTSGAPSGTSPAGAAAIATAAQGNTQNACENGLIPADLTDLLGPASGIKTRGSPTNEEACNFDGPGIELIGVVLRAGDEVAPFWKLLVDLNHNTLIPLAGVGDAALRTPDASGVVVRKGAMSCQIDVIDLQHILDQPAIHNDKTVLTAKLGALCAKIFAARHV